MKDLVLTTGIVLMVGWKNAQSLLSCETKQQTPCKTLIKQAIKGKKTPIPHDHRRSLVIEDLLIPFVRFPGCTLGPFIRGHEGDT